MRRGWGRRAHAVPMHDAGTGRADRAERERSEQPPQPTQLKDRLSRQGLVTITHCTHELPDTLPQADHSWWPRPTAQAQPGRRLTGVVRAHGQHTTFTVASLTARRVSNQPPPKPQAYRPPKWNRALSIC